MFDKIKKIFKKKPPVVAAPKPKPAKKTPKEIATEKGEPFITIVSMDVDPENLHNGNFELDWNDKFVSNLVRAGYQMDPKDTDADIVDRWFTAVCRNVVLETYEQYEAIRKSETNRVVQRTDTGGGMSEYS